MLWILFITFLKIGFFSFGGGYAVLSLIMYELIEYHKWLTTATFETLLALSQITPGPIAINAATFTGWTLNGFSGAFVATIGLLIPSVTITLLIFFINQKYRSAAFFTNLVYCLRITVVGLILASSIILSQTSAPFMLRMGIFTTIFVIQSIWNLHPFLILSSTLMFCLLLMLVLP